MLPSLRVPVLCALLAFLTLGVSSEDVGAATDPPAQRALDAITAGQFDPGLPDAVFPEDFADIMGYRPVAATGPTGRPVLIKPDGDCSAFSGETSYGFGVVCKEHDLAYDVLRYSAAVGRPLPSPSRRQADAMFGRQLHSQCSSSPLSMADLAMCHVWAESFALSVTFNSWRQGFRPPALNESLIRWQASFALFFLLMGCRRHLERLDAHPGAAMLHR